ncbi:acetate--CoA ligase [Halorarius halobius]|uniref:acetate--CoA ligase n=1 Tax=Halorarius halobius TaxID=2962671 RepID=UPI0020CF96A2|nr:acetate--CoA ligase [Halorarius halobius]
MAGDHVGDHDGPIQPPASFVEGANVTEDLREQFEREGPDAWSRAADTLDWSEPYDEVLRERDGALRWFDGGRLNASYNCVDRHLADRKNHVAIRWEGTTGESRTYTYLDLYHEVNEAAAGLRSLGVEAGDVVTLYMPVMPELPVVMLACARLGALHNVVFAGFSADELAERLDGTGSEYLVTCDGYYRRGTAVNQKNKADNARMAADHDVETVVVTRLDDDLYLSDDHVDYGELLDDHAGATVDPVERAADDPLFVIYTSGTTGEPDQVVHTTGGYLSYVTWTGESVLDIKPSDTYWCAADVAWITGHSYMVYAPLALGTTTLLYEGAPDQSEKDRLWELVERHRVDVFYTASTVVRAFVKWGEEHPAAHDLSSLRLLGTVGEPIDPRTWTWYREHVGGGDAPVVDTWWQTETGGILVSTLPAVDPMKPGAAGPPLPGHEVSVVDYTGDPVETGEPGHLAVTEPWPGMPRGLAEAAVADDWTYVTSDRAVVDGDGYVTFLGREDDTVAVGDTAYGPATLESAVIEVGGVAEAAVVESETAGEKAVAYVCTERDRQGDDALRARIENHVADRLGPTARFEAVIFTPELPKTHSGKIMRRLLSAIADGEEYGDTSALRNPETVGEIETVSRDD